MAALASFVTVLLLLAERMRNAGRFTMADVLAFRLNARPARTSAAIGTLFVVGFYLVAQMIAAGALFEALAGITFPIAVVATGVFMLASVIFGGMLATTWVQIVKAVLLMTGVLVLTLLVLNRVSWNPFAVMDKATQHTKEATRSSDPVSSSPSRSTPFRPGSPQFLVSLTFAVAASANFPSLLLALIWPRFNTTGALVGVGTGLVVSIGADHPQPHRVARPRQRGLALPAHQPGDRLDPARLRRLLGRHDARGARAARALHRAAGARRDGPRRRAGAA